MMIKHHEVVLKSGRKLDAEYRFYPGEKATMSNPASAPEVVIHRLTCPEIPWYIANDEQYEEVTNLLLAWEDRRVTNY